jgi:hypothetical protein
VNVFVPALGHRVQQEPAEVALTNVEGREQHLEFLHRIDRHVLRVHLGARRTGRPETEHVTLGRAVDLHVVHAVRHAAARVARPDVATCGVSRMKSVRFLVSVGRRWIAVSDTMAFVPVFDGEKVGGRDPDDGDASQRRRGLTQLEIEAAAPRSTR